MATYDKDSLLDLERGGGFAIITRSHNSITITLW